MENINELNGNENKISDLNEDILLSDSSPENQVDENDLNNQDNNSTNSSKLDQFSTLQEVIEQEIPLGFEFVQGICFIFTSNSSLDLVSLLKNFLEQKIGISLNRITIFNVTDHPFMIQYMIQLQRQQIGESLIEEESKQLPQVFFNDYWIGSFQDILNNLQNIKTIWETNHKWINRSMLGILYQMYREQEAIIYTSPSTLTMLKPNPLTQYAQGWITYSMLLKQPKCSAILFKVRWSKKRRYSVSPNYGVLTNKNPSAMITVTILEKIYDNYESDFFEIDSLEISESQSKEKWTLELIEKEMEKMNQNTMCDLITTSFVLEERRRNPGI